MVKTVAGREAAEFVDPLDVSHPDICLLLDRVSELERALAGADRYLEACRDAVGALEGELLIDAIKRRLREPAQPEPPS